MMLRMAAGVVLAGLVVGAGGCAPDPAFDVASGCSRAPAGAFPDVLPVTVPVVVMQAPVAATQVTVVMAASWVGDHWSERTTFLVGPGNPPARIRARDLPGLPQATQVAYRAVFDCTQVAVTAETPSI
ncbi:MAG: hypothetical protein WCF36_00330 [Candidatus Nanopelagicales bacterium]